MGGTAVEAVPGGLIDRVGTVADGPARRRFDWHVAHLVLPDGTARPLRDVLPRAGPEPARPDPPLSPSAYVLGRLLPELWYWRTMISPSFLAAAADEDRRLCDDGVSGELDRARAVLAGRPDLLAQVDLLAADVAARFGAGAAVERRWRRAMDRFADAGDHAGGTVALVVRGDLHAGGLSSPVAWNCELMVSNGSTGELLPDVERREFVGPPPAEADRADRAYAAATERYAAVGDRRGIAAVDLRRGWLALVGGRPERAMALAGAARAAFEQAGRPADVLLAATHEALAALAADRHVDRDALLTVVERTRRTVGPATVTGLALLCLRVGRHWTVRERPEPARAAFDLAGRLAESAGAREARLQALFAAASAAQVVGDTGATRAALRTALRTDAEVRPDASGSDGNDPGLMRRVMSAQRLFALCVGDDDLDGMIEAHRMLREAAAPLRDRLAGPAGPARYLAQRMLEFVELPDWTFVEPYTRARRARATGDFAGATRLFADALAAARASRHRERYMNEALASEGDDRAASAAYSRHVRDALDAVGSDPLLAGVPGGAEREVRLIHERGLAVQLGLDAYEPARAHRDALAATADPWWSGLGPAWRYRVYDGRLRELAGDLPGALAELDGALDDVDSVRAGLRGDQVKTAFHSTREVQSAHVDAARVALRLARLADDPATVARYRAAALGYLERGQSRALLDLMRTGTAASVAELPPDLVARWRSAGAAVTLAESRVVRGPDDHPDDNPTGDGARLSAADRLEAALAGLRDVEAELARTDPAFWAAVNPQADTADPAAVCAALEPGVTLLHFALGARDLVALAVTRDGVVGEVVCRPALDPAGLVAKLVTACAGGGDPTGAARDLATMLLDPLREAIRAGRSLVVVAGGPLIRLPFPVLPFDGEPLGARRPVAVAPNASALTAARRPAATGPAVVIGDPAGMVYRPGSAASRVLSPLPGTRVEAVTVAALIPAARRLLGPEATADAVAPLLPDAVLIHLATHGVLDPDSPLGSSVLLADGQELTAARLLGMRLNADLVVLSACHTGDGGPLRGGELLGIGRALLAAGARAALVTRWAVNDLSATLLMAEFHRLRVDGAPTADALRLAGVYLRGLSATGAIDRFTELAGRDPAAGAAVGPAGPGGLAERVAATVRDLDPAGGATAPFDHPYHWAPFVLVTAA